MSIIGSLGGFNYLSLVGGASSLLSAKKTNATDQTSLASAQTSTLSDNTPLAASSQTNQASATAEFQKYMQMTPAEKIRYNVMSEMGITDEQLAAMPPDERAKVEKKIADLIELRTNGQVNGQTADSQNNLQQGQATITMNLLKQIQTDNKTRPLVDVFS